MVLGEQSSTIPTTNLGETNRGERGSTLKEFVLAKEKIVVGKEITCPGGWGSRGKKEKKAQHCVWRNLSNGLGKRWRLWEEVAKLKGGGWEGKMKEEKWRNLQ